MIPDYPGLTIGALGKMVDTMRSYGSTPKYFIHHPDDGEVLRARISEHFTEGSINMLTGIRLMSSKECPRGQGFFFDNLPWRPE